MVGDVGGWGAHGGSKDARVTVKHTVQGQTSPVLQVSVFPSLHRQSCSLQVKLSVV